MEVFTQKHLKKYRINHAKEKDIKQNRKVADVAFVEKEMRL